MATKTSSLLQVAREASLASRSAAAAASRAARAADAVAGSATLCLAAMGTKATSLLRAARKASLASRAAAAAASRAARAADVAARLSLDPICHPKSCSNLHIPTAADYDHLPEDSKTPTDKDFESDDALWALYERWCEAFDKRRNYYDMARRFEVFRYSAEDVHSWNTDLPPDPKKAAIFQRKRREVKLLLSKGEDVSHFDECYLPAILGPLADGGDPFLHECDYDLLKHLEKRDPRRAPKDVIVE